MIIYRYEMTDYPNTKQGRMLADEYEKKLKEQGVFSSRRENTTGITISAAYQFNITDEEDKKP